MIKVKLIEKKNKSGEIEREVKSEKEIKKNKNYEKFISELSKAFPISEKKFILMVFTEEEDEYPIENQEDLDDYFDNAKEFTIIMEEGSAKSKSSKKSKEKEKNSDSDNDDDNNVNNKDKNKENEKEEEEEGGGEEEGGEEEDYLKKIKINVNLEFSEQEFQTIMDSVQMPEINNINDDTEFDIENYKQELNNKNNTKVKDFKQVFETQIQDIISQKSSIIKENISKLVLDTQKEQGAQLQSIEEETSLVQKDFKKIVENTNEMNVAIGDLKYKLTGEENEFSDVQLNNNDFQDNLGGGGIDLILDGAEEDAKNKDQNIIRFEEEVIKREISLKEAKFFNFENISIINNGQKELDPLYFSIDTSQSPKDLLFVENSKNTLNHRLTLNGPLKRGEKLENYITLHFDNPKIGEYTAFIYVKEKPNTENLSKPLKLIIKITENPEDIKKREEEEKRIKEEKEKKEKEEKEKKEKEEKEKKEKEEKEKKEKEEKEKKEKEEKEKKKKEEKEKKEKEEKEKKEKEENEKKEKEGEGNGNEKKNIDYKDVNQNDADNIFNDLENEYNISSIFDKEEVYKIIIEYKCDREKVNKWIEDKL